MKKILIINGHPNPESFNFSLGEKYKLGALESDFEIEEIFIGKLKFNPNLEFGYSKKMELEEDLKKSVELIKKSGHIVFIHPVWWGGFPAIMKGFFDRIFIPGVFNSENVSNDFSSNSWKFLAGKTARIILTSDIPAEFYRNQMFEPSVKQLKNFTLEFCGIENVEISYIGNVSKSSEAEKEKYLQEIFELGKLGI